VDWCVSNIMHPFLPLEASFPASFLSSPMFAVLPTYLTELKSVLLPTPAYCENSSCEHCGTTMILTEHPMEFYEPSSCDACSEATLSIHTHEIDSECTDDDTDEKNVLDELEEEAFDDYINSVLDNDYGW
jgi:hypothetical protein